MNANQLTIVYTGLTERVEALTAEVSDREDWAGELETRTHVAEVALAVITARLEIETTRSERTKSLVDEFEKLLREVNLKLATQEVRTGEALRRVELIETRYWWFVTAVVGMLFALVVGLIVALVKR